MRRTADHEVTAAVDRDIDITADRILSDAGTAIVANGGKIIESGCPSIDHQVTGHQQSADDSVGKSGLVGIDIDRPAGPVRSRAQREIAVGTDTAATKCVDINPVAGLKQQVLGADRVIGDDKVRHRRGRSAYAVCCEGRNRRSEGNILELNIGVRICRCLVNGETCVGHATRCGDIGAGAEHDMAIHNLSAGSRLISHGAADQHGQGIIFGNGHHIDGLRVGVGYISEGIRCGRGGRTGRGAAVDHTVDIGCSHADRDVEQAVVDRQVRLFCCDIGGRTIDRHGAALNDPRGDHSDIAAAVVQGVDRRAIFDGHRGKTVSGAAEPDFTARTEQPACRVDIVRGQHQPADIKGRACSDHDPAGTVEPDIAASRAIAGAEMTRYISAKGDSAGIARRGGSGWQNPVQHRISRGRADKCHGGTRRKDVDQIIAVRAILRRPVDECFRSEHRDNILSSRGSDRGKCRGGSGVGLKRAIRIDPRRNGLCFIDRNHAGGRRNPYILNRKWIQRSRNPDVAGVEIWCAIKALAFRDLRSPDADIASVRGIFHHHAGRTQWTLSLSRLRRGGEQEGCCGQRTARPPQHFARLPRSALLLCFLCFARHCIIPGSNVVR